MGARAIMLVMATSSMLLLLDGSAAASLKSCTDDNECAVDKFCYLGTLKCASCFQCSAYNRQDATGCAKEAAQCGDCLQGFEREILTDGRTRDLCVQASYPNIASTTDKQFQPIVAGAELQLTLLVGVAVFLVAAAYTLFSLLRKTNQNAKENTRLRFNDSSINSSIALYTPSAPPVISELKEDAEEKFIERFWSSEKESAQCQMAGVFQEPVWVKSSNNVVNQAPPGDTVDGPVLPNEENPPYLIDENTQPSDWTPGPLYGGEEQPPTSSGTCLTTSFEGILRLNAAASSSGSSAGANEQPENHSGSANGNGATQFNVTNNITVINTTAPSTNGIFNFSNS